MREFFYITLDFLQGGTGPLKVKRKPKTKVMAGKLILCIHCQGMSPKFLPNVHVRKCLCKPENENTEKEPGRTKVLGVVAALETASSHQISSGVWKLLTAMKQDDIASVVRNDLSFSLPSPSTTDMDKTLQRMNT